jgi:phenylalanyl-tRNA synthetase beta chain
MLISYNWLKEITDFSYNIDELSDILTMLGIEVESYTDVGKKYNNFFVTEIIERDKHPNADKLSVCTIVFNNEKRKIVCGAPNAAAGQKVVIGIPGAIIPESGIEIEEREIRGIQSGGMLCSQFELNLGADKSGLWILPEDAPIEVKLSDYLNLNDIILDIGITPNRADCLSHIGIAREIAAYSGNEIRKPFINLTESEKNINDSIKITIEAQKHCPRYTARIIRNIQRNESPLWLKIKLILLGLRPLNLSVDVTNFIMLESGQPLHAFDLDNVGGIHIIIKTAQQGEEFITLDSKKHTLDPEMLMICDADKSIAIGGVMGGENTEINIGTKNILLESAYFTPSSIRRTAKKLGIQSDASYRFERGGDIENIDYALNRAAELIAKYSDGTIDNGIIDTYPVKKERIQCSVRFKRAEKIIGIEISPEKIISILEKLNFKIIEQNDESVLVESPSYRVDMEQEIDLIEEIARLYNYDNISPQFTSGIDFRQEGLSKELLQSQIKNELRNYLVPQGFNEVITQTQTDPVTSKIFSDDLIHISNPLGEEISIMRPSLIPSMLRVIERNIRHGNPDLKLFEIGKTFHKTKSSEYTFIPKVIEKEQLIIALTGKNSQINWSFKQEEVDFYDIKGIFENIATNFGLYYLTLLPDYEVHPAFSKNSLKITFDNQAIGNLGEIKKDLLKIFDINIPVFLLILDLQNIYKMPIVKKSYKKISPYPIIKRDLAFILDYNIPAEEILNEIKVSGGELLTGLDVFDVYSGNSIEEGKKNIAFSLVFSSSERTLKDEEIDLYLNNIILNIENKFSGHLRKF